MDKNPVNTVATNLNRLDISCQNLVVKELVVLYFRYVGRVGLDPEHGRGHGDQDKKQASRNIGSPRLLSWGGAVRGWLLIHNTP